MHFSDFIVKYYKHQKISLWINSLTKLRGYLLIFISEGGTLLDFIV